MEVKVQIPSFWPSRRLWAKLLWASICVPLLFQLLIVSFIGALFENKVYVFLFFVTLIGGSALSGMLLVFSWRGLGAGLLASVCMFTAWYLAGSLIKDELRLAEKLEEALSFTLVAGSGVSVVELVTRDVHVNERSSLIGLLTGIVAGFFLSLVYAHIFMPIYAHGPRVNNLFLLGWSAHFTLVWLSVFFFTEFSTRRVGWGGALIWAGLIVMTFGVSMLLMR